MFEDFWEPESLSDSDDSDQRADTKPNSQKRIKQHLIFLVYGYKGKYSDMKYIKSALVQRHPKARIHIVQSMNDSETTCKFIRK